MVFESLIVEGKVAHLPQGIGVVVRHSLSFSDTWLDLELPFWDVGGFPACYPFGMGKK